MVTVVALVVANVWVDLLLKLIHWWLPGSYMGEFIVAVIVTALAIPLLHKVFGKMDTVPLSPISTTEARLPPYDDDDE